MNSGLPKKIARVFALAIAIVIFGHHLICTLLLVIPKNPATGLYGAHVLRYMSPLFSQNWRLFAPEPAMTNTKLLVNCVNGETEQWFDPIQIVMDEHYTNRFTFRNKLAHHLSSIPRELVNASQKKTGPLDARKSQLITSHPEFSEEPEYLRAIEFAESYCALYDKGSKAKLRLVISEVEPFSSRFYNSNAKPRKFVFDL